jgi:hypothetical protein
VKIIELLQRPGVVVTNEELDLLETLKDQGSLDKKDLKPREIFLIDQLVNKNLVIRKNQNESIVYTVSKRVR